MDQAGAGDTVEIAPGTYGEALVLDKSLTLRGGGASASDVVIDGSSGSSVTAADGGGEVPQISIHGLRLTSTF